MKKVNETNNNTQAQAEEVKEAPKATKKATKAETPAATKPETKAATAAAPSSPEPPTPTPTATTKPVEKEEQEPIMIPRETFRLSRSIQLEKIPVPFLGMWTIDCGTTNICLSEHFYRDMLDFISRNKNDYKAIVKRLNNVMKIEHFDHHTRHDIEETLIKELGNHYHTHKIRRIFL